tara:strand:+ start:4306 stop:4539 length:234 start_codon:yes stop_codon:yes gene_type:complete
MKIFKNKNEKIAFWNLLIAIVTVRIFQFLIEKLIIDSGDFGPKTILVCLFDCIQFGLFLFIGIISLVVILRILKSLL